MFDFIFRDLEVFRDIYLETEKFEKGNNQFCIILKLKLIIIIIIIVLLLLSSSPRAN